ncbi:MAG TPA: hypothetical protein VE981_07515 [Planctomycetota bacterium]|nr:hypothetical protein [Planctomycetota bacterium]
MADWKDFLAFPFRAATAGVRIMGRITFGITGFVLMGGGLLLMSPMNIYYLGIPIFLVGLLLLVKSIF